VRSGADRRGYALTLLRLEEERGEAPLSGSHFSGHALEERIEAIMKRKNVSLAALLAVLAVMSVTTTVFATSAPVKSTAPDGLVTGREISAVAEGGLTISRGPDGEKYVSLDGGETWMDQEQYHAQYGPWGDDWEVEWWTYDEYKAWLEQEKKDLADIIGSRGYTSNKGWFVWDQAMVDETIALYEQILEHIKNGGLYSKSITGPDGVVEQNAVLASGTADVEATVVTKGPGYVFIEGPQAESRLEEEAALLDSLRSFGVTVSVGNGLYYNDQLIRCLVDGYSVGDGGYGLSLIHI